jgi:hypothetical protein
MAIRTAFTAAWPARNAARARSGWVGQCGECRSRREGAQPATAPGASAAALTTARPGKGISATRLVLRPTGRGSSTSYSRLPRLDRWGRARTGQISHTKGGVLDGIVAFEGSTNWSASGEGTGINLAAAKQNPGFKAQNNTLNVYVNPYEIAKFAARVDYEHAVAAAQPQPAYSAAAAAS